MLSNSLSPQADIFISTKRCFETLHHTIPWLPRLAWMLNIETDNIPNNSLLALVSWLT